MLKHYVTYLTPGFLFSTTSTEEIPQRNDESLNIPCNCYGYELFDRYESIVNGVFCTSKKQNVSGVHYFGEIQSLDDLAVDIPDSKLYEDMRNFGFKEVVRTKMGTYHLLSVDDIVLSEK